MASVVGMGGQPRCTSSGTSRKMENVLRGSQELELEILTGHYAGETANVTNYLSAFNAYWSFTVLCRNPQKNKKTSCQIAPKMIK